jgi:predicted ABC-type sugar transport system permease subunit
MKTEDLEAALRAEVETIFERCAGLCGFSVAERLVSEDANQGVREWELYVSAVAAYPELGATQAEGFIGEISGVLADLLDQRPQAADLLPGRTFARIWH